MIIDFVKLTSSWKDVYSSALTTVGKESEKEPSSSWKNAMLLSEHSPIRRLRVSLKMSDIPYFASVHLVRHKIGVEHFVSTQRTDRTGLPRGDQDAPVTHEMDLNAQALITISRKRLCKLSSKETRYTWENIITNISLIDMDLYSVCVPECIYRGYCYEMNSCGYYKTRSYGDRLEKYRSSINKRREEI